MDWERDERVLKRPGYKYAVERVLHDVSEGKAGIPEKKKKRRREEPSRRRFLLGRRYTPPHMYRDQVRRKAHRDVPDSKGKADGSLAVTDRWLRSGLSNSPFTKRPGAGIRGKSPAWGRLYRHTAGRDRHRLFGRRLLPRTRQQTAAKRIPCLPSGAYLPGDTARAIQVKETGSADIALYIENLFCPHALRLLQLCEPERGKVIQPCKALSERSTVSGN